MDQFKVADGLEQLAAERWSVLCMVSPGFLPAGTTTWRMALTGETRSWPWPGNWPVSTFRRERRAEAPFLLSAVRPSDWPCSARASSRSHDRRFPTRRAIAVLVELRATAVRASRLRIRGTAARLLARSQVVLVGWQSGLAGTLGQSHAWQGQLPRQRLPPDDPGDQAGPEERHNGPPAVLRIAARQQQSLAHSIISACRLISSRRLTAPHTIESQAEPGFQAHHSEFDRRISPDQLTGCGS